MPNNKPYLKEEIKKYLIYIRYKNLKVIKL
jgi:hypothetical protein